METKDFLLAEKAHIEASFKYLVCHVGTCEAKHTHDVPPAIYAHWLVYLNGRLYVQQDSDPTLMIFQCKTESGTVTVSFLASGAI